MAVGLNIFTGQLQFIGGEKPTTVATISNGDWGVSGSNYTLTILQTAHKKGLNPIAQVMEDIGGGDYKEVTPQQITVNASGDVTIEVSGTPIDNRFDGKVFIK